MWEPLNGRVFGMCFIIVDFAPFLADFSGRFHLVVDGFLIKIFGIGRVATDFDAVRITES